MLLVRLPNIKTIVMTCVNLDQKSVLWFTNMDNFHRAGMKLLAQIIYLTRTSTDMRTSHYYNWAILCYDTIRDYTEEWEIAFTHVLLQNSCSASDDWIDYLFLMSTPLYARSSLQNTTNDIKPTMPHVLNVTLKCHYNSDDLYTYIYNILEYLYVYARHIRPQKPCSSLKINKFMHTW